MADQFVEEFGADERMRRGHRLAEKAILDPAQNGSDLALDVGARRAEDEVDRDLIETKFGEVIVERGPGAVLYDAAQRVHLHVLAGLGMLATHQCQLAVHHLDEGIGGIGQAQRWHALDIGGQDHIIMWDPGQGEAAHRAGLAIAHRGGGAQRD